MGKSAAYERFMASTNISYVQWHDGDPYDLEAFGAMPPQERDEVVRELQRRHGPEFDWRDIEVFQAAGTPESIGILEQAMKASHAETRLHAAAALHVMGRLPDLAGVVAGELDKVTILDGMAFALSFIGRGATEEMRRALLRGARDRPEVAVHYARKICYLAGKGPDDPDGETLPVVRRIGEWNPPAERARAFVELCAMLGVEPGAV